MKIRVLHLLLVLMLGLLPGISTAVIKPVTPEQTQFLQSEFGVGSVEEFLTLNVRNIQDKTGKKLKLRDKIVFKLAQRKVKKQVRKGHIPNIQTEYINTDKKFHFAGFLLGLTLGVVGIFIAVLLLKNAGPSSLIGYGILLLGIAALVAHIMLSGKQFG